MTMIRQTTKVKADGTVEVQNAALTPGDEVEVIVLLPNKEKVPAAEPYGCGTARNLRKMVEQHHTAIMTHSRTNTSFMPGTPYRASGY